MKTIQLLLVLGIVVVVSSQADTNRCGYIPDDSTAYTIKFDSTNGHSVLSVKIVTNSTSGYKWQDIINDRDKWDSYEPWVYCTVSIGGGLPTTCTAERRGDWSMESSLPSLKVKLEGARYKGMDRLLLNKHPWDPTRVKAKLTFELLQQVDNMASLFTQFATLTVDGKYYGVYTLLEDMDEHMLEAHGMNTQSLLYKANYVRWNLEKDRGVLQITDPKYKKSTFERYWDIRGRKDHTQLINAYNDLFNANVDSRSAIVNHFNVHNLATWIALVFVTANTDLIFNNFGIYAPATPSAACHFPTPFYHLSWDNDGAWDDRYLDGSVPGIDYPYYEEGVQYFWRIRVVKRFLQVDEFVDMLLFRIEYLIHGPFSSHNITSLTRAYKRILLPLLSLSPDHENIAWDATVLDWMEAVDSMASIPTGQYQKLPDTILRPMPIDMRMNYSLDGSSLFFFWEKSFVLYNKPFFYEFTLATDKSFTTSSIVYTTETDLTFTTFAVSDLVPSTIYFWKVIVRNSAFPSNFIDSYPSLHKEGGWGIQSFTSPDLLPPLSPQVAISITHEETVVDNMVTFRYATLDNIDPTLAAAQNTSTPLLLPTGWSFAPNNGQTRLHLLQKGLPWGGSTSLVLHDGSRVHPGTGKLLDGFGELAQYLVAQQAQGGLAYYTLSPKDMQNQQ